MKKYFKQLADVYCREFRLIFHDQGLIVFLFLLPLAYPVIYSLIYNPELVRKVKMVAVDHDRTQLSRELVRRMDAAEGVYIIGYAADLNEARRAMNSHDCYGILEIPEGFGRKVGRGETAEAVMYSEMSLLLRYRGFLMASTAVAQEMGAEIQQADINRIAPLASTLTTGDPMKVQSVTLGNLESGFDSFIMPGIVILILQQCLVLAVGLAGGAKRENPALIGYNSVNAAPSPLMTMSGHMLCYITLIILPAIWLVHYVPLVFAFPMAGNTLEEFLFLLPMVIASICMGFCLQGILRQRESVFLLWVITSVIFLFLSGLTWPRYAMTGVWRVLSDMVPATWGVEGFIKMNTNGSSLTQVQHEYYSLWICAAGWFAAAYVINRFVVRRHYFSKSA